MNREALLPAVVEIARDAGRVILEIYDRDFEVVAKGDGSPLTEADRAADALIHERLRALTPDVPILSEESVGIDYATRRAWTRFWLVDPLDGTKEFVNRNGQFTVNIALIENGKPALGAVTVPVSGVSYYAAAGRGATRRDADGRTAALAVRRYTGGPATVVVSRSHRGMAVDRFLAALAQREGEYRTTDMGSSLKLCLVAEGAADVYPRLGPTSEWDVAAGHCIVEAAGGRVIDLHGRPLVYNKENILNPWFLACGAGDYDWTGCFDGVG
ncbi:MAG TPA: 3'(2'),5'-bisphosphate nucleotidase CysQ [Acidiferrobacterales bacterium]